MLKIAILGWGSLLWDVRPEFDRWHGPWQGGGPAVKLEFSRISRSRSGVLTLVIDPCNGAGCSVAFALSTRTHAEKARDDLRQREGTSWSNIGYVSFADGHKHYRDGESGAAITAWGAANCLDAVVWTDLPGNFEDTIRPFSVATVIAYLQRLDPAGRQQAIEYIHRAPGFVQTPLRTALAAEPWFVAAASQTRQSLA